MKATELRIGNTTLEHIEYENIYIESDITFWDFERARLNNNENEFKWRKPMPLTEEWLLKFGFENWGLVQVNEKESYIRFVLYNVLGGTSNYEVHFLTSNYGNEEYKEIIYSIDHDEPQHVKETAYVHNLQNHYFLVAGYEINE